jgi:small nuclear ribonucleoprotein (snRNP)-like protein
MLFLLHAFSPVLSALPVEGEQGQSVEQMKKVVRKAMLKNKEVKVVLKDKRKYVGRLTEASEDGFVVTDSRTATPVRLAFVDTKQVSGKGLPTIAKVAIGAGVVVAGLAILANVAIND